jgi:phosphopantetheinyl transferase
MPLIFEKEVNGASLGVWHIVETEACLRKVCRAVPDDILIVDSFLNESRRKQWLACRAMLGQMLRLGSVKVCYDEHGKPSLDGFRGQISFSHTREYAAVMINVNGPAGIDIEKISPRIERVAERFLQDGELENIRMMEEREEKRDGDREEKRDEEREEKRDGDREEKRDEEREEKRDGDREEKRDGDREENRDEGRKNPHTELLYIHWCSKEALYKFYGKPTVDLKNDIYLIPFDYFCNSQATFQARVVFGENVEIHDLGFERIEDHVLVYTIAKPK